MNTKQKARNSMLLAFVTIIWGVAFVAQSKGADETGPYSFNCIRSLLGGLVLLPVISLLDRIGLSKKRPVNSQERKTLIIGGIACGVALFVASTVQQLGIFYGNSVGKAGFLTACYIVIVPILSMFYKERCGKNVWVGVGMTLVGLYLLCIKESFLLQKNDILLLLSAFCFSIQILLIDYFSPKVDGVRLAAIEFFTCGILGIIPMVFIEIRNLVEWFQGFSTWNAWGPILYAGILSCGVAYTLQIIGQNGLNPTVASLIMSLEAVISVLAGWLLLGQKMSAKELIGCGLMFGAIVIAQIPDKTRIHVK